MRVQIAWPIQLVETHLVEADLRSLREVSQVAESAFVKALELNPKNALVRHGYGLMLLGEGRLEEGLDQHLQAQKPDSLSPKRGRTV